MIDEVRPAGWVLKCRSRWQTKGIIDRRAQVFWSLRLGVRMPPDLVRRADYRAAVGAAAREEYRLNVPPMVPAGKSLS